MLHGSLIQTSVTGNVTRNENNLPLAEANIVLTDIRGITFGTMTDENGNFNLVDNTYRPVCQFESINNPTK